LTVFGWPPSVGAGLFPEHDRGPLMVLPVMEAGPPILFPARGTPPPFPDTVAGPLTVAPATCDSRRSAGEFVQLFTEPVLT
jgi:hypothetical protein